jgi:hypothetical protein
LFYLGKLNIKSDQTLFDGLTGNAGGAAEISQFEQNQSVQGSVGEFNICLFFVEINVY